MHKRVDEPELLAEFITEHSSYSADRVGGPFQALVLRLIEQHQDSQLNCVPVRIIYGWLADWKQAKKSPSRTAHPLFGTVYPLHLLSGDSCG